MFGRDLTRSPSGRRKSLPAKMLWCDRAWPSDTEPTSPDISSVKCRRAPLRRTRTGARLGAARAAPLAPPGVRSPVSAVADVLDSLPELRQALASPRIPDPDARPHLNSHARRLDDAGRDA